MDQAPGSAELARRYGPGAAQQWQLLEHHLQLGSGFALVILLVPDLEAVQICKTALAALLSPHQRFHELTLELPELMYDLAENALELHFGKDAGAVWISGVPRRPSKEEAWKEGWRYAAARLNERRDLLRRQIGGPCVLCGPHWLGELLRETSPDLWSVRTLVIRIPPCPSANGQEPETRSTDNHDRDDLGPFSKPLQSSMHERLISILSDPLGFIIPSSELRQFRLHPEVVRTPHALMQLQRLNLLPDPESALIDASRMGQRSDLAARFEQQKCLLHAAYGFAMRRNSKEVKRLSEELWVSMGDAQKDGDSPNAVPLACQVLALQAWSWLLQQDSTQAHRDAKRSIEMGRNVQEQGALREEEPLRSGFLLAHEVWANAAMKLGLADEIEQALDELAHLFDSIEDPAIVVYLNLLRGVAERVHGRPAAAEQYFRRAQSQEGAPPAERALASVLIADGLFVQQKKKEAEGILRSALNNLGDKKNEKDPHSLREYAVLHAFLLSISVDRREVQSVRAHSLAIASSLGTLALLINPLTFLTTSMVLIWALSLISLRQHREAEGLLQRLLEEQRARSAPITEQKDTLQLLTTAMILAGHLDAARALLKEHRIALSQSQKQLSVLLMWGSFWPLGALVTHSLRLAIRRYL